MLGRSRMRRGVSLEVIVEEDDNAEVTLDPLPLLEDEDEEDEDEEEDEEEDSENANSSPESPGRSGGTRGGREGGGGGSVEERRRRRERRKTVGLSRVRSVSCETLTLLDTSDMDSCWSEWDDEEDHPGHPGGGRNSSYVTLHHPISRRRILQSSSHCDSEDSGIEYQSNEDDQPLDEAGSSARRRGGGRGRDEGESEVDPDSQSQSESNTLSEEEEEDDIHDQETATESDDDDDGGRGRGGSRFVRKVKKEEEERLEVEKKEDERRLEEEKEEAEGRLQEEKKEEEMVEDKDEDIKVAEGEEVKKQEDEITKLINQEESETEAIRRKEEEENRKLLEEFRRQSGEGEQEDEVERRKRRRRQEEGGNSSSGLQDYKGKERLENDKVVIVETSPIVPLVKPTPPQLEGEEGGGDPSVAYAIRNKEVVAEELPKPHTVSSVRRLFEDPHTPLGHLTAWRNLGRFRDIKSNPSSKILRFDRNDSVDPSAILTSAPYAYCTLPRRLRNHQNTSSAPPPSSSSSGTQTTPRRNQVLPPFPSEAKNKEEKFCKELQKVKTQGGQEITLRKPTVRGFNVKKALQDDPRTFLHAHTNPTSITKTPGGVNVQGNAQNGRRSHVHFAKHKTIYSSEFGHTDRSDTESLASDISEDSGVCHDANSNTTTSQTLHHYTKWIDPAVMAKIRAVGTTVIFFGPRKRPHLPRSSASSSSTHTPLPLRTSPSPLLPSLPTGGSPNNALKELGLREKGIRSPPIAAPRIVGVLRKKIPVNKTSSGK